MLTPIRCQTCGLSLGDIAPIYQWIRRKRVRAYYAEKGIAPTRTAIDRTLTENIMGDVLDALQVGGCCRTHLVTAMLFTDHY